MRSLSTEEAEEFDRLQGEVEAINDTLQRAEAFRAAEMEEPAAPGGETAEEAEERAFAGYVLGTVSEQRAGEQNMTMGNNGAIIPTSIANRIVKAVKDRCPILQRATIYRVKGTLKVPVWGKANSTHDIKVGYHNEFTELTADSGAFASVDLGGYLAGALTLIGKSVENNAAFDVVGFIVDQMAEEFAGWVEGKVSIKDKFSAPLSKASKSLEKLQRDAENMGGKIDELNKRKAVISVDAARAKKELKAAEKALNDTKESADRLEKARYDYENIQTELRSVTSEAKSAEKQLNSLNDTIQKGQNRAGGISEAEGYQTLVESQTSAIWKVRDTMADSYWEAGYYLGQEMNKGIKSAIADGYDVYYGNGFFGDNPRQFMNRVNSLVGIAPVLPEEFSRTAPGHASGLRYVPYDDYPARLHEGERVLTAREARGYGGGVNVSVTGNQFTVREEADIDRIAETIARRVTEANYRTS